MPMNKTYSQPSDLPATIPLFPLAGALLLPGGQLPLNIFEPRYLAMFDDAMRGERIIGMIQPVEGADAPAGERPALRAIGAAGRITQLSETGDGRYFVILSGIARFRILSEVDSQKPYREAWVDFSAFPEDFVAGAAVPAQRRTRTQQCRLRSGPGLAAGNRAQRCRSHARRRHDLGFRHDRALRPRRKAGLAGGARIAGPRRPAARARRSGPVARRQGRQAPAMIGIRTMNDTPPKPIQAAPRIGRRGRRSRSAPAGNPGLPADQDHFEL